MKLAGGVLAYVLGALVTFINLTKNLDTLNLSAEDPATPPGTIDLMPFVNDAGPIADPSPYAGAEITLILNDPGLPVVIVAPTSLDNWGFWTKLGGPVNITPGTCATFKLLPTFLPMEGSVKYRWHLIGGTAQEAPL